MDPQKKDTSVFHSLKNNSDTFLTGKVLILFLIILLAGLGGGYILAQKGPSISSQSAITTTNGNTLQKGSVYGSNDTSTFKDTAEGTVTSGGINGEGQFHLVRPGGDSQNVYMTSSLVDLSLFIGKKVKVWGQTQKAKTAGWLMDVGRVEVEN